MSDEEEKEKVDASLPEENDGEEGEQGGVKPGLDARKIILFFILPLLVIAGIGGGLFVTGTLDKMFASGEGEKEAGHGKKDDGHGHKSAAGAAFLPMPDMLVNLSTPDGQPRYLRLRVQLELESKEDIPMVEAVMPRVVDQFQTYLRELRVSDLRGSAGIYRLQIELLARVNAAAYPVEVKDVLFQEILIQ